MFSVQQRFSESMYFMKLFYPEYLFGQVKEGHVLKLNLEVGR